MFQLRDDTFQDRLAGILLGTAVGDSVGLPAEGLSSRRRQHLLPDPWPRSVGLLRKAASRLEQQERNGQPLGPVCYFWPAVPLRNLLFLIVVLLHGIRRLAPPY